MVYGKACYVISSELDCGFLNFSLTIPIVMERGGKFFGYSPGQMTLLQGSLCNSLCSLCLSSSMAHPEESKKVWFSGKKVWFSFDIDHTFLQFLPISKLVFFFVYSVFIVIVLFSFIQFISFKWPSL